METDYVVYSLTLLPLVVQLMLKNTFFVLVTFSTLRINQMLLSVNI